MISTRAYQDEAEYSIFDYYATGNTGNPIVAMPTASGKSVVIGKFVKNVITRWPRQRICIATHVKELIQQNYNKLREVWPEAPAGIYSAGLYQKDTALPIIFCGVQSMVNNAEAFGWRDLFLVDEAHLISGKESSNYGKVIAALRKINPNMKVIGFTATKYRMGSGLLSDGPVFTDCCFDLTSMESFNRLINEGYLCNLVPKRTKIELNVSDVKIQAGDYVQNQLQAAVDKDAITYAACKEICEQGADRYSWLVFASGIEHAKHIAQTLQSMGINALPVHSKMKDEERDKIISDFKTGQLQCCVNYGILTTGFDHPGLDLIAMLRPTTSTVLWVQMLGRGTRPFYAPGMPLDTIEQRLEAIQMSVKQNCLVLDFAGNTKRLGPINDPVIPKKKGQGKAGVAPVRICEKCGVYNHARATHCFMCGFKFDIAPKITKTAATDQLIITSEPVFELCPVQRVIYSRHVKDGAPPMIKVSYFCGLKMFTEFICLEHKGLAKNKAHTWWLQRMGMPAPPTTDEALLMIKQLKVPRELRVWTNRKYPEIMAAIF
jgi:DNA repair protein RadD